MTLDTIVQTVSTGYLAFYETIISHLTLDLSVKFAIIYALIVWLACIIWVINDVTNRTTNLVTQVFAILIIVIFTPIFGLPVYLLVRPRTTLFEQYYEETSLESLETPETCFESDVCPKCHGPVEKEHHYCPHCGEELLVACTACGASMHGSWQYCPEC